MSRHSGKQGRTLSSPGSMSTLLAALSLAAGLSSTGCAHGRMGIVECPKPSPLVSVELERMMLSWDGYNYEELLVWIGEIERHCAAISEAL
jgi:hypothetical protein